MDKYMDGLYEGGRFLPYGYTVPSALAECLTWQVAMQWIADNLEYALERIAEIDPSEDDREIQELKRRVTDLEETVTSLSVSFSSLSSRVGSLEEADFQSQINRLTTSINNIDESLSDLHTDFTTLSSVVSGHTTDIADINSAITTIELNLSSLTDRVSLMGNAISQITQNLDTVTSEFHAFMGTTNTRFSSLDTLMASHISQNNRDIASINTELTRLENEKQNKLTFDTTPTENSTNPVTSGGLYEAFQNIPTPTDVVTTSTFNNAISQINAKDSAQDISISQLQSTKQDNLTFDSTPTSGSNNPVTSDGIYQALQNIPLPTDAVTTSTFNNAISEINAKDSAQDTSISQLQSTKQDNLSFDSTPTSGSSNPVTSNGIYQALQDVEGDIPDVSGLATKTEVQNVANQIPQKISAYDDNTKTDTTHVTTPAYVNAVRTLIEAMIPVDYLKTSTFDEAMSQVVNALSSKVPWSKVENQVFDNSPNPVTGEAVYEYTKRYVNWNAVEDQVIDGSPNPVTGNAVYDALQNIPLPTEYVTTSTFNASQSVQDTNINTLFNTKQDTLTFDNVPTSGSTNPVKSDGIYQALAGKQNTLTFDTTPTENSTNPVTSDGVYDALQAVEGDIPDVSNLATKTELQTGLAGKQNTLTFDDTPDENSTNPVTSAGIKAYVDSHSGGGTPVLPTREPSAVIITSNKATPAYSDIYTNTKGAYIAVINANITSTSRMGILIDDGVRGYELTVNRGNLANRLIYVPPGINFTVFVYGTSSANANVQFIPYVFG